MRTYLIALLLVPLVFSGCGTVKPEAAFLEVQSTVVARSGQNPEWIREPASREDLPARLHALLEAELTVETAQQIALFNNHTLQASFEEIGISQADLVQAGLLRNPQISASVRFPDRPPSVANTEFGIGNNLLDLIITPLRRKIAAQQLEQTKLRVTNEVLKLLAEVKRAFYTLQAREQLLVELRTMVAANEAAAELAARQHEAGTVNELGLISQQTLYSQSKLDLAQAEIQRSLEREKLNRLLGLSGANTKWKVAPKLPEIPTEELSDADLEAAALAQRLDLAIADKQVELAERALSLKRKTRYLPTGVDLEFSAERDTSRQWVRGPQLSLALPIFDWGQGQVPRLESELRQAQRQREALAVQVESEVRETSAMLRAGQAAAQEYRTVLLPNRARIIDLYLRQYNFMLKGPFDLLNARQQQAQAEHAYIEIVRDYWVARCELERVVGGKLVGPASNAKPASPPANPAQESEKVEPKKQ